MDSVALDPHGFLLPGMTRLGYEPTTGKPPFKGMLEVKPLVERPLILLATATITTENMFSNGLFQNVFLLYRMFDAMGWTPLLLVNTKPKNMDGVPDVIKHCRVITAEDLVKQPIPIKAYIEIGMSLDSSLRRFLKMTGARICKLYLGNILNIDVETPVFYPGMHFSHHVVGEMQEIWVSPHYGQHSEYAAALNHVDPGGDRQKIAPYVWDPCMITDDGRRRIQWRPRREDEPERIIIMEPNISFQKSSLVPIMAMERWFRKHPDWKGEIHVFNGERLNMTPFFKESILPTLELHKAGKITLLGRSDIVSITAQYPSATFLLHQWNNEYNYMLFELLWCSFPVIHNAQSWSPYGYFYNGSDLDELGHLYDEVSARHNERLETYRSHARALAWKHSPYNPEIQKGWSDLLRG
jgi:hypothetical protein